MLATRRHKPEVEGERFDAGWKAEADERGLGAGQAAELLVALRPAASRSAVAEVWRLDAVGFDEHGATRRLRTGRRLPRSGSPTCCARELTVRLDDVHRRRPRRRPSPHG